ncbi:MAG: Wzz/FepE/Etk N-terminal domain-containing protein, partial [Gammaproteobacteria bacterium]|nr:Wzz/FepE/Etk N-terminal domain-containing protein [Gammaproteobacteria bacterium]
MIQQHNPSDQRPDDLVTRTYQGAGASAREFDLVDLWRVVIRQRWIVLFVALLTTAAAVAAAFLMTPVYRAQVLLAPVEDEAGGSRLATLAGQFG